VLYGINPLIAFQTLGGIEVVFYTFMITLTLFCYYRVKDKLNIKNIIFLGLMLGLTMLARIDGLFLIIAICLHIFWISRKNIKYEMRNILILGTVALLIVSPWFIWSYTNFGTIVQSSAIARFNMNHGIFPFFDLKEPKNLFQTISMIIENLIRTIGSVLIQLGVVDFNINIITIFLSSLMLITLLVSLKNFKKLIVNLLFVLQIILFYNLYLWGIQIRYITPIIPTLIILISSGLFFIFNKIEKYKFLLTLIVIVILVIFIFNGYEQWNRGYFSWQKEIYKDALWIRNNTNPSDNIGVFSAGIPIYFSERRIINLDGVLNFNAIEALKNKSVINYMKISNITIWYDSVYFNRTVTNDYLKGRKIDILKENIWYNFLGEGKENLKLIEQREGIYKHLRGFDMVIVFFKAKLN